MSSFPLSFSLSSYFGEYDNEVARAAMVKGSLCVAISFSCF